MNTLGKRISFLLDQKNLTQKELAKMANVTEVSIGRYINGKRQPNATALYDIAKALDTTTDYLLGLPNKEPETTVLARKLGTLSQVQIDIINQMIDQFEANKGESDD
ncbi:transcriptional repressor DicA [Urinicoccus massiliensis]|uniref:Transcriptional repressor DicA n=1 Tax=Urinicoccus massiliensis TaxID=1723382 RepID=A0A8H2M6D6_9FIRM|nr:helix-turn-helix transcriptional regulator [Urinicoccus massiliensis]VFB17229.1 transcriptional repressor DicA [Urinicoccus massiliensis]